MAGLGDGDNVGSSFGRNVESLLPDELEKKLDIEEAGDATNGDGSFQADDIEKFGFKSSEKGSDMFAAAAADNALPDQIKNLKIKDYAVTNNGNNKTNQKDSFAFGSRESIDGYVGGENESTLSHEMGCKLEIGSAKGETSGQTNTGFSSRRISRKDVPTVNKGDKKLHDCGDPSGFVFEGGMPGKDVSGIHAPMDQPKVDTQPIGVPGPSLVFSSSSSAGWNAFRVPPTGGLEKTDGFNFTSKQDGAGSPFVEFKTPNPKGNVFTGLNPQMEFSTKFKDSKEKKKRGKLKQPVKVPLSPGLDFVIRKSGSHEIPEASESYAPSDISPFQETLSDVRYSRESSVTSEESFAQDSQHASTVSQPSVLNDAIDEDLVVATQQMDIDEEDMKYKETKEENSENCFDKGFGAEIHVEECITGAETESFKSANEEIDSINDVMVTLAESEANSSFTFAASSTAQVSPKHHHKKNNFVRVDNDSFNSSATSKGSYASSSLQFTPFSGPSSPLSPVRGKKVSLSAPSHVLGDNGELHRGLGTNQGSVSASVAAQEACEKWRLRGNKAYTSGALMLCYSNRAATRMSLGRMRDALGDCKKAAAIDPNFIRVQVRAANCYLALGDVEGAVQYFKKCLQFGIEVSMDRKVAVEAADGLQKAQKVTECMQHSAELLRQGAPNDAESALQVIAEGLLISSCSEKLLEMKAESLFMLRKYEEVIQLCEHSFDSAKKNSPPLHAGYHVENNGPELTKDTSFMIWRCRLIFKSYFHLGRLEEAIGSLEKQVEPPSTATSLSKIGIETQESLVLLAATVHKLIRHKAAGNEAFQAGKHSEAIEHYSAALSHNIESRPFAAICFCNRAAAYKALGQITDATADCSLAIALDGNYLKAISRRATLYEMIRDYGQAARDLQRLVAVLTKQVEEKTKQSGHSDTTTNLTNDLRQACLRLSTIEEAARKEVPLNMYLILGIEPSASVSEVKKAYHKAALRHHPDKAGQSLARSDNGDDRLWKEIGEEVHKDTDRLFKMIGEAYAMLSDPAKREQYDLEEVMRNDLKKQSGSSTYRTHADAPNYPFERSSRRQWKEGWRPYGR
ncbi:HEAT SHOCK PROTEIN DNAJ WITH TETRATRICOPEPTIDE REPEAT-CONTAINING PROTEIN [Salix koriyanagi]|uniref:HEAT SHOCK PROTEIN DNAJ WITH TETRATRICOPEPTIDE REPEAT-CONTAINING PROTEIN n=1 Tax=Salix koriyanagi TaxID=2511006 RepID=A0A9Q1AN89_9ROSI|nr:HEAT SHOCK PROTEIN DNAJ WITH TETRATRICOPEPTIDE REPEAT-CONTAINING PROTEIN [Salix koriyanagi]